MECITTLFVSWCWRENECNKELPWCPNTACRDPSVPVEFNVLNFIVVLDVQVHCINYTLLELDVFRGRCFLKDLVCFASGKGVDIS